jgi:hypothetical protein
LHRGNVVVVVVGVSFPSLGNVDAAFFASFVLIDLLASTKELRGDIAFSLSKDRWFQLVLYAGNVGVPIEERTTVSRLLLF